ncbi:EndoU domain-containing protein [Myxococcaceae bacterium JPH2]|nr:EndoU domain-containing protein [Myxococcaceae bacterium JPH2]
MRVSLPLSACVSVLVLLALPAWASGAFVSEVPEDAVEQPESKTVVFTVEPGVSYPLIKKGGPNRAWCKLKGPTAEGWVRCDGAPTPDVTPSVGAKALVAADHANSAMQGSGQRSPAAEEKRQEPSAPPSWKGATGCATTCEHAPLFTAPPTLSPLDREVLDMCPARPDVSVSAGDVQRFFARHHDDARIQRALSAAGRAGSKQADIEWLTSLWVSTGPRNAFTHVFCGDDWERGPIGGLHFLPRYAQLEAEGKLCYGGPARGGNALQGGQYRITFRGVAPWSCGEKRMGGFQRTQDAVSIAAIGTRAFVRCCARGGAKKEGGVYSAPDLGGSAWRIWCGTRNGTYGIASLYPTDEAPTCSE